MNRREALRFSALAGIGGLLPAARAADRGAPVSPEMAALSAYMSQASRTPLPADVEEAAKHHLLDTTAAMVSGSQLTPGQAALRYARARFGKGSATIVGPTLTAGAAEAAFANGMMAHADETDGSHGLSRSHPGCAVVPAALATGEEFAIEGAHFLRAITLGYDVGPRVSMAMGGPAFSYRSHKSTQAIAGVFGAAAAAACSANLDAQQMRWVLDYTAQQSAGIAAWQRDTDHIEKAFVFAGMPARNGVTAALLVQSGWNGIFSGDDNFFLAYAPTAMVAKIAEKLGEQYEIARTDIKKWPVGSPIQAPLDALEAIRKRRPFEADQVTRVTVRLAPAAAAVVDNRDIPDICLQHMVAVMLLDKSASFKAAHDKPRMQDAAVLRQRAKVQLIRDEALQKFLPVRVATVEVALVDGTTLVEGVQAVRGTTRNPMSRAEVVDKCRELIEPVLGSEQSTRLIATVLAIETVKDIRELRPLLQVWPFIDAHVHLDKTQVDQSIEDAVRAIPVENSAMYLFLPSPFTEQSALSFDIEMIQPVAMNYPGKVAVIGGGGTLNPMLQQAAQAGSVSPELGKRFRDRAYELVRLGAAGFGEFAAEHRPSASTPSYQSVRPDHPLLLLLADVAGETGLPITLHLEAVTATMPVPSSWIVKGLTPPRELRANIADFERLLAHNARAKIVWAHGGWDNTGCRTPELCRQLLQAHPNLYMELKIDPQRCGLNSPLTGGASGMIKPEWLRLFQDFPDRFVMGSDQHYPRPDDEVQRWQGMARLFIELPPDLRRKFGTENVYRIYRLG